MTLFSINKPYYQPAALQLPARKFSYRFLLSTCLFFLILFSLALQYTGISIFILLFIDMAFCADILLRCAWQDLLHARGTFSVLISLSVVSGFIYCALNTFLARSLSGPQVDLHVYVSFLLTLSLWVQYRLVHEREKTKIFIKKLDDFLPKSGRLCEGKKSRRVFANELTAGDQVLVYAGERIPCDGIILEGSTAVDEQLISGNICHTVKQVGSTVYAGTLNKMQTICVEVKTPLSSSAIMSILSAIKNNEVQHNCLVNALEKVSVWLAILLGVFAGGVYTYTLIHHGTGADWLHQSGVLWLILALGCPVGWLFSVVFPSFFIARGARQIGIFLNYLDTVQTFVQADTIFLDKTGTLTVGKLEVSNVIASKGYSETHVLTALVTAEQQVDDIFARAILEYGQKKQVEAQAIKSVEIFPGQGIQVQTQKGAILAGRLTWLESQGIKVPALAQEAEAVVCVAQNNCYLGYITLTDSLRQGAAEVIQLLKEKNKEVILISGDTEKSVQRIAQQVGIEKFNANVLPKTKAEIITNLRALGKRVVMIGDGFNDIIALLKANGGIVFGSARNVYNHWVDIVIKRSDLYTLTDLFKIDKRLQSTIWGNMVVAVSLQCCFIAILLWQKIAWMNGWQAILGEALLGILLVLFNSMRLLKIK